MSSAEGTVLPKPGIPKTLGILNIIFGVCLVLFGFCTIGLLIAAPSLMKLGEDMKKQVEAKAEAQKKETEKSYDDRIAAAKTDEEKKALEQEKAAAIDNQPQVAIDLTGAEAVIKDPKIMAIGLAGGISGLILHIILLISGIGLVRLAPWSRSLACWWAGLQVVQIIVMLALAILITLPANKPIQEAQLAKLEKAAQGKPPSSPEAVALQMSKMTTSMEVPLTIGSNLLYLIYPIICLVLLNNKGARAALLGGKPESK
jgi:Sec-independent protein translocase protein TatA